MHVPLGLAGHCVGSHTRCCTVSFNWARLFQHWPPTAEKLQLSKYFSALYRRQNRLHVRNGFPSNATRTFPSDLDRWGANNPRIMKSYKVLLISFYRFLFYLLDFLIKERVCKVLKNLLKKYKKNFERRKVIVLRALCYNTCERKIDVYLLKSKHYRLENIRSPDTELAKDCGGHFGRLLSY